MFDFSAINKKLFNFLLDESRHDGSCVVWKFRVCDNGYARGRYKGTQVVIRRVIQMLEPADPRKAKHLCNNKACVNPAHLTIQTAKDNMLEDTHPRGERNGRAKFTNDQVIEIRIRRANGETTHALAAEFGTHHNTISRISIGKVYSDVGGPRTRKFFSAARLSDDQVEVLRRLYDTTDLTQKELSAIFDVSQAAIKCYLSEPQQ